MTENIQVIDNSEEIKKSKEALVPHVGYNPKLDHDYSKSFRLDKLNQTTISATPPLTYTYTSSISQPQLPRLSHTKPTALGVEIAQALQRNEKLMHDITKILIRNIHIHNEVMLKLSKKDEKQLNELLDQLSTKENVSTVKSLLNIVTSATAITMGAILLAPETIAAIAASTAIASISSIWSYLLIATGISNIVSNEILPRIGGYEKIASFFTTTDKDRKNLAENIQITTSLTTTIVGVASSIATSSLLGAVLNWNHGLKLLNTTLELSKGATNFLHDINEHDSNTLQAKQTIIDGQKTMEQALLDRAFMQLHSAKDIEQAFNKISFSIFEILKKMQQQNTK